MWYEDEKVCGRCLKMITHISEREGSSLRSYLEVKMKKLRSMPEYMRRSILLSKFRRK